MSKKRQTFGQVLREARLAKGITLRKFAEMVGISPTYLSQVEQDNADPATVLKGHVHRPLAGGGSDPRHGPWGGSVQQLGGGVPYPFRRGLPTRLVRRVILTHSYLSDSHGDFEVWLEGVREGHFDGRRVGSDPVQLHA